METINRLLDQPSTNRLADKTAPLVNDWQGLTDPNFDLYHKKIYKQWNGKLDEEQTDKRKLS